jgi:hypothetical protein
MDSARLERVSGALAKCLTGLRFVMPH